MNLEERKPEVLLGTILFYCFHIFLHKFSSAGNNFLFPRSIVNTTMFYHLEITPNASTFVIWDFTYIFQLSWMVYTWIEVMREKEAGKILSTDVYLWLVVHLFLMSIWFFFYTQRLIVISLAVTVIAQIALNMTMYTACTDLYTYLERYPRAKDKLRSWYQWLFVQNSIIFHATWTSFMVILQACIVMKYDADVSNRHSSLIGLSMLTFIIIIWFYFENNTLKEYIKYTFSNYIAFTVALSGVIGEDVWQGLPLGPTDDMTIVLLVGVLVLFFIRVLSLMRSLYEEEEEETNEEKKHLLVKKLMYV